MYIVNDNHLTITHDAIHKASKMYNNNLPTMQYTEQANCTMTITVEKELKFQTCLRDSKHVAVGRIP